ncbi:MAG: hypothetical protein BWZ06_01866 [Bacteroidetes bacterium ADurb.BinA261]|nr:MAG: hypothetical protein BWZ06_01866 [Bacteroidetes bacterium ADurb.BinA261]
MHRLGDHLFARFVQVETVAIHIIHATKALTHVNRPTQRSHRYLQFLFQFVENIEGVLSLAIHLVYKNHHRRMSHPTNFHQFSGLSLHSFGRVHYNNHAIDSRKRSISIFGKILMTGSVEDIDFVTFVFETHN